MNTLEVLTILDGAIAEAESENVTQIQLAGLKRFAADLRRWHEEDEVGRRAETEQPSLLHSIERFKFDGTASIEMFRSVIEAGQSALKACMLVNGGAAVSLLAFLGHVASGPAPRFAIPVIAGAMGVYVIGVLAAASGYGFRYLSQGSYEKEWHASGIIFHVLAIATGLASLAAFAKGSWLAYRTFVSG